MKNKGIWYVIAGIVVVGIVITICNSLFMGRQKSTVMSEPMMNQMERSVGERSAPQEPAEVKTAAGAEQMTVEETVVISPLETQASVPDAPESVLIEETGVNYRSRLDELDLQIQRIRSEGTESTTYSMKTAAENELKLWDSELNTIYNDILTYLDEEETQKLIAEEREWMKERDAKAVESAKKFAGGSLEGLEYTASLAESTRRRAYALADFYEEVSQ